MDKSLHQSEFVKVNGIRLHYLDWRGHGPALLFLAGMGCSAHIFDRFAPRFTDKFRVLALTRRGHGDSDYPETGYDSDTLTEDLWQFLDVLKIEQGILVGHSLASVELSHFTALYPERVLKLVFLDAAYDYSKLKVLDEKDPLSKVPPLGANDAFYTIEEFVTHTKRIRPDLADIWSELLDEEFLHSLKKTSEGRVVDKMSDDIAKALTDNLYGYSPEYSKIRAPTLSIYAIWDNYAYWLPKYLTAEQKASKIEFIETVQLPLQRDCIEQFRRDVPGAKILEIPNGHHYCFIKHEELVYEAMRKFLLES